MEVVNCEVLMTLDVDVLIKVGQAFGIDLSLYKESGKIPLVNHFLNASAMKNNFPPSESVQLLSTVRKSHRFPDCELLSGGFLYTCHKDIVGAKSAVLMRRFSEYPAERRFAIGFIPPMVMCHLLDILYTTTSSLQVDFVECLYNGSKVLEIEDLKIKCIENRIITASETNAITRLIIGITDQLPRLYKSGYDQIVLRSATILQKPEWLLFTERYPEVAKSMMISIITKRG